MAGGKMSPRQKMINLMYLVFIAMLAMNMDKEVLAAFGLMTEELTESTRSTAAKNAAAYGSLGLQAQEQAAKFGPLKLKADKIKDLSNDFYSYLEGLKSKMTADVEDVTEYSSMDKSDFLDEYFFVGDDLKPEGQEFVSNVDTYREEVVKVLGNDFKELQNTVESRFNTKPIEDDDGKLRDWIDYRYKGYPLVASLTNLTQLQANIKNTESDVLTTLLQGELLSQVRLSNYKGIVALDKNAYFAGEKVTGKIVLGRYDSTMVPDNVILNGRDYKNIQSGQVIIDMPAGNVGSHDIKGKITFTQDGEPEEVPFESSYSVIPEPSSAVVSADKMNVVYRGLDNPISVSLPGVGANNINVTASGGVLSGSNGKFSLKPGGGNEAVVNVSAKLSSGKTVNSKAVFRIKPLPPATGLIRGKSGPLKISKASLESAQITVGYDDFDYDLKFQIISFRIFIGNNSIIINGSTLNDTARRALSNANKGDKISIYDFKATANGEPISKVFPIEIELTN